ncbi:MAG TPA: MlaD family protein [Baekduia sp.]|nr:MlaD family protein [Baekduia sp.]
MSKLKVPTLRRGDARPASKTRGRPFLVSLGVLGVLTAVVLLYVGYMSPKSIPGRSYYTLEAEFTNADNLTPSYQVRIGGRLVGQVLDPRVEDGKAVVDLQLTPDIEPLRSDTTLRVRPRSPVGVRFVELVPGTKGRPLGERGRIPVTQTDAAVQIDEALGTLDADRRQKAKTLLNELGAGFLGRGEDINEAQGRAPEFLDDLEAVATAVTTRTNAVQSLIQGSASAADAAEPVREDIARGFEEGAEALQPFVQEREAVRRALRVAPGALRSVQADLTRVDPLLTQLERFGANATPALREARPTLAATTKLLQEADPGLAAARRTLGLAREAVSPTLSLLRTLGPVLPDLDKTLDAANPILAQLAPRDCDLRLFFNSWTEALANGDGFSNVLRFETIGSAETVQGWTSKKSIPGVFQVPYTAPCEVTRHKITGGSR